MDLLVEKFVVAVRPAGSGPGVTVARASVRLDWEWAARAAISSPRMRQRGCAR